MLFAGKGDTAAMDCVPANDVQDLGIFFAWGLEGFLP